MSEFLDLSDASLVEVKSELGLVRHNNEPFYRNDDNRIVLFRGEHSNRNELIIPDKDNSLYGDGAYLGNSPTSVAFYAGNTLGVNAYVLPEIEEDKITRRRVRVMLDASGAELVLFPVPLITQLATQTAYPESKYEELPKYWALLPLKTALLSIQETIKIAWLGRTCLGAERQ